MIAWLRANDTVAVAPDPRYVSFEIFLGNHVNGLDTKKINSVGMNKASKEKDPEFFYPNSYA